MAVLELLARTPAGMTLAELSRALDIGPSSLLALLATLRAGSYVHRRADDRYGIDAGVISLGARASACLRIYAAFTAATARLNFESITLESGSAPVRPQETTAAPAIALSAGELAVFLGEPLIAVLAYHNAAGYPSTVPVWYRWDGASFWLVPGPGARWLDQLRRDPRISLTVSEAHPPLRRVNAEGIADVLEDRELARQTYSALAERYGSTADRDSAWAHETFEVVRVDPIHLVSSRGLTRRNRADDVA